MPLQVYEDNGIKKVSITESFTINEVASIKKQLEEFFNLDKIIFDLSKLSEFDSAALQLLFTFKRDREKNGLVTEFEALSEIVSTFLKTYNMEL